MRFAEKLDQITVLYQGLASWLAEKLNRTDVSYQGLASWLAEKLDRTDVSYQGLALARPQTQQNKAWALAPVRRSIWIRTFSANSLGVPGLLSGRGFNRAVFVSGHGFNRAVFVSGHDFSRAASIC